MRQKEAKAKNLEPRAKNPDFDEAGVLNALLDYAAPNVFNQYTHVDEALDKPDAAQVRVDNLRHYLRERRHARVALVGEAAGYNGCRFSGIPFTCEAQFGEWADARFGVSSRAGNYVERSARCVWGTLGDRDDWILWNTFPWHPHRPHQPLSNRTPTRAEWQAGAAVLRAFLDWAKPAVVVAVGRVAETALQTMGVAAVYARHPAYGGNHEFRKAVLGVYRTLECRVS